LSLSIVVVAAAAAVAFIVIIMVVSILFVRGFVSPQQIFRRDFLLVLLYSAVLLHWC